MNCLEALQKGDLASVTGAETSILRSLIKAFNEVYVVNLETELIMAYMKEGKTAQELKVRWPVVPYTEAITSYVQRLIVKEEQERILGLHSIENLKKHFSKYDKMDYECHKLLPEGRMHTYVRWIKLNEQEVVLGVADIREEKNEKSFTRGHKLIVAEDNALNREILVSILEDDYQVLAAENGEAALELLKENYEDVAVILTDLDMPVCDGKELIRLVRLNHAYDAIPIIVTTAADSKAVELDCLKLGASDFATKPYEADILKNRIKNFGILRNSTAMLNTLIKDPLTGLYTKAFFDIKAKEIIDANPDKDYWIVCSNIVYFRRLKEKYDRVTTDEILTYVAEYAMRYYPGVIIGGRISDDVFCYLQEKADDSRKYELQAMLCANAPIGDIKVKHGRVAVDRSLSVDTLCDFAKIAVDSVKDIYGESFSEFDEAMYNAKKIEGNILDSMERALEEKQFIVYYQPKHDLQNNCTGGAEALVRWIHPEYGFMNPGAFIPIFEKNGFIRKLDDYVWQRVCEDIASWKQQGVKVVPVSVNVSRRDFDDENLAASIISHVEEMGLEPKDLHLEITESAYSDNPERIAKTVQILHDYGFVFELDDFGAGYSSLNALNNMNLDVMKIDMSIIRKDKPGSKRNVLELCINLANLLGMKTVAEGVETAAQVERLRSLGCDYIQGYYYSAPKPLKQFEEYLKITKEQ